MRDRICEGSSRFLIILRSAAYYIQLLNEPDKDVRTKNSITNPAPNFV